MSNSEPARQQWKWHRRVKKITWEFLLVSSVLLLTFSTVIGAASYMSSREEPRFVCLKKVSFDSDEFWWRVTGDLGFFPNFAYLYQIITKLNYPENVISNTEITKRERCIPNTSSVNTWGLRVYDPVLISVNPAHIGLLKGGVLFLFLMSFVLSAFFLIRVMERIASKLFHNREQIAQTSNSYSKDILENSKTILEKSKEKAKDAVGWVKDGAKPDDEK